MKTKCENENIDKTIVLYQKNLMCDMNLTLRLSDSDHTYITKPTEWSKRDITFEAPIHQLDWVIFSTTDIIDMVFISKFGLFHSRVKILKKYKEDKKLLYVAELISPLIKKQQREYFRLETIFNLKYKMIENYNAESTDLDILPTKQGICLNISTGGMCFNTYSKINVSEIICISFNFVDIDFILYGKILEIGDKNSMDYYPHRVQFINMDTLTINSLTKCIFDKQRSLIKPLR